MKKPIITATANLVIAIGDDLLGAVEGGAGNIQQELGGARRTDDHKGNNGGNEDQAVHDPNDGATRPLHELFDDKRGAPSQGA